MPPLPTIIIKRKIEEIFSAFRDIGVLVLGSSVRIQRYIEAVISSFKAFNMVL